MAARRLRSIVALNLGRQLALHRGELSRPEICRRVSAFGLALDPSTLFQYEKGSIGSPDPAVLWALARVYHIELDDLITVLVMDRTGRPIRSGVTITGPGLTKAQLEIAELFGALSAPVQECLRGLLLEINSLYSATLPHVAAVSAMGPYVEQKKRRSETRRKS